MEDLIQHPAEITSATRHLLAGAKRFRPMVYANGLNHGRLRAQKIRSSQGNAERCPPKKKPQCRNEQLELVQLKRQL